MKYKIIATKHFQKDVKRCKKRNLSNGKAKEGNSLTRRDRTITF